MQGALGRLCAGDKDDSSVFKCVCVFVCMCIFVCVQEHVCALETCVSMFGACTCKHLKQHVNKCLCGYMLYVSVCVCGIGVGKGTRGH